MGAISGFSPDYNGNGKLSIDEINAMRDLGLNTSDFYDENGKLKGNIRVKNNTVFLGNGEERIYERANLGNGSTAITATSVFTNANGEKTVMQVEDIEVSEQQLSDYYNTLANSPKEGKSSNSISSYYNLPTIETMDLDQMRNTGTPPKNEKKNTKVPHFPSALDPTGDNTKTKNSNGLNLEC